MGAETLFLAQQVSLTRFEEIIQLTIQGLALGSIYALIALGFVIIYKATEVINFAHGALMLVGAFVTYTFASGKYPTIGATKEFPESLQWYLDMPLRYRFVLAVLISAVVIALLAMLVERVALRPLIGQPIFAVVLVTLGVELVLSTGVQIVWGPQQLPSPSPFPPTSLLRVGNIGIQWGSIWSIIAMVLVVIGFFLFFRFSKYGLAMKATSFDQEAAMAMGIKPATVFGLAWAIGGALAAIAGAMYVPTRLAGFLTIGPVRFSALNAFPAAILGGLDSPGGAVIGGLTIGVAQVLSSRFLNPLFLEIDLPNFHLVFPYILMIIVLLIRPYGLFGTKEVRRV